MSYLATATALARGLHLAASLSLLGATAFGVWTLPAARAVPPGLRRSLSSLRWISGALALLAGAVWFTLQAAAIASADTWAAAWGALPVVALHTRFGNLLMARLGLLLAAVVVQLARRGLYPALALSAAAISLQGAIGHAGATAGATGDELVLSEALHLLAAGLWLGALLPLWLSVRALSAADAGAVCLRFSPLGLGCVLILAGTGFVQALELIGDIPALFGTTYGYLALLKIGLFLLALLLAAINRLWLTDRLSAAAAGAQRQLMGATAVEAMIGLAVVMAAAFLASTVPGTHQQPVWPFSWRLSLSTINEDADSRLEVITSAVLLGGTILVLIGTLLWRRFRVLALVLCVGMAVWRGPSFSLLMVEAYPTSFQTSPTGFSTDSIVLGQKLFAQDCAACHGPDGRGNGPAAAALSVKPADLTQPHLWAHSNGELFWWLTHGIDGPEGGLVMPGFGDTVSPDGRWALIDYVRAHNAGVAFRHGASLETPLSAPALPLVCDGISASAMADLRGRFVLVDLGADSLSIPRQEAVEITVGAGVTPAPGACAAASASAWDAYAILADVAAEQAGGTQAVIDRDGWLRVVRPPTPGNEATEEPTLLAIIHDLQAHPIQQPQGVFHAHHH